MENLNIMIVGVGGQGTLLTSRIIGNTAQSQGFDVKISEVHGMAQRGGSVVTYVRFGNKVAEPVVEKGHADILIAFEKLEALRYAPFLKDDGVLIVNDCKIEPMTVVTGAENYPENIIEKLKQNHKVYVVNGESIAKELGNSKVLNSVVLGFAAKFLNFPEEVWIDMLKKTVPPKTVDINEKAFKEGFNQKVDL